MAKVASLLILDVIQIADSLTNIAFSSITLVINWKQGGNFRS